MKKFIDIQEFTCYIMQGFYALPFHMLVDGWKGAGTHTNAERMNQGDTVALLPFVALPSFIVGVVPPTNWMKTRGRLRSIVGAYHCSIIQQAFYDCTLSASMLSELWHWFIFSSMLCGIGKMGLPFFI